MFENPRRLGSGHDVLVTHPTATDGVAPDQAVKAASAATRDAFAETMSEH